MTERRLLNSRQMDEVWVRNARVSADLTRFLGYTKNNMIDSVWRTQKKVADHSTFSYRFDLHPAHLIQAPESIRTLLELAGIGVRKDRVELNVDIDWTEPEITILLRKIGSDSSIRLGRSQLSTPRDLDAVLVDTLSDGIEWVSSIFHSQQSKAVKLQR